MKFTEAQLESAIIELLGAEGNTHVLGEASAGNSYNLSHSLNTMANELIFYKTPDGEQRIEVVYEGEDFWMSQRALAELFSVKVPAISKHLKNIFESGELAEEQVVSILETTTQHGAITGKTQTQKVKFYSLDAIIAVGYRVNSYQGKQFGQDYFDELLERIREIRASERSFHQKITDLRDTLLPKLISGELRIPEAEQLTEEAQA